MCKSVFIVGLLLVLSWWFCTPKQITNFYYDFALLTDDLLQTHGLKEEVDSPSQIQCNHPPVKHTCIATLRKRCPFSSQCLRQTDRQTDRHADRERYSLPAIRLLYTVVRCSFPTFMRIIIYINKQNCRPHQLKNNNSSLSAHNEFSVSLKRIVVPLVLRLATMKLKRKRWSKSN